MPLNTKTFTQFVDSFVNDFATETNISPVLSTGSRVYGLATANSGLAEFLQYQSQEVLLFARSTTSTGPDLDSWMAQFNFPREGATFASGQVTLSVPSPASIAITIPVGTVIQVAGGAIQYALIADTNQSAFNVGLNAYVLPINATSITATAQALVAGSASNVLAGQLNQFASASSGVSNVTNLAPIDHGSDSESDAAYRQRFILYINNLSLGTYGAIMEACLTAYDTFTYTLLANTTPDNTTEYGYFTVIANNPGQTVDDNQLTVLGNAINAVRAFTIQFSVVAPTIVTPSITLNIAVSNSNQLTASETAAQTAIIGYVNSLLPGQTVYLSDISNVALNASTYITAVQYSSVTINDVQEDYVPADQFHIAQANLDTVSVGEWSGIG